MRARDLKSNTVATSAQTLTRSARRPNICRMASSSSRRDSDELKKLEARIDELIDECQRLRRENQQLKSERGDLSEKHARLMEKTRIARERIEAMIGRLKALERT